MKIYDISGNEIHGKEVVFESYLSLTHGICESFRVTPKDFKKIVLLGVREDMSLFSCYLPEIDSTPFLYLGKLNDIG